MVVRIGRGSWMADETGSSWLCLGSLETRHSGKWEQRRRRRLVDWHRRLWP